MAIPFLLKALPSHYELMLERRSKEKLRLSSLEREVFGWDHAQAAAHLCRQWHLPEDFATLIERHPSLNELMSGSKPQFAAACVALAALLPACKDTKWEEEGEFHTWFERINQNHQVSLPDLMAKVDEAMEGFAPIMNLPVPDKSLTAFLTAPVA
jgi:HD-like signal output (HDOD) protein